MDLFKLLAIYIVFNSHAIIAQWNIQTGYDFGVFTTDYYGSHLLNKKESSHYLHRLNAKTEYQFKNNFFLSFNSGIDYHDVQHNLQTIEGAVFDGSTMEQHSNSIHHSTLQSYRLGLSLGYRYSINNVASFLFSINYDQFFINRIKNKKSSYTVNYYSSSEVEDNILYYSGEEYRTMIDLREIGYRNKFKRANRYIIFSIGYRYQKGDFFMNPSIGFSPRNNNLVGSASVIPKQQNLFLFGINFGYTLPKKTNKNEK